MRCFVCIFLLMCSYLISQNQYKVYFNEIRANDDATDDIEFIELIGPAGTNLSAFKITHFNGSETVDGGIWQHVIGPFTIPDDGITDDQVLPLGFYVLAMTGVTNADETIPGAMQNGPDGLVLYDASGNILDAVAWEGAGDLVVDDPGTVFTNVAVNTNSYLHITVDDDAGDNSLQSPNNGYADDGSGWLLGAATPGAVNFNQISGDISLPVELLNFSAKGFADQIVLHWQTVSETENTGFNIYRANGENDEYHIISSYRNNSDLLGFGNSPTGKLYSFTDKDSFLKTGKSYYYKIADINYTGHISFHGPVKATITISESQTVKDSRYILFQNYPNPFNPVTEIKISLKKPVNKADIEIFDLSGRKVKSLYSGPISVTGFSVSWDGTNQSGKPVASGYYFYCFKTENKLLMKKMLFLK